MKLIIWMFRGAYFFRDEEGNILGQFTAQGAKEISLAGAMEVMNIPDFISMCPRCDQDLGYIDGHWICFTPWKECGIMMEGRFRVRDMEVEFIDGL